MPEIPPTQLAELPDEAPSPLSEFVHLTSDLPYTPEPNVTPPVVKIHYSENFDKVLSAYRAMVNIRNRNGGLLSSAVFRSSVGLPRWLLTLGYVLTRCPAHYTVWKERRDLIFRTAPPSTESDATPLLSRCCIEQYPWENHEESSSNSFSALSPEHQQLVAYWIPSTADLSFSHRSTGVSVWRCVAWELRLVAQAFAKDYHKNFQLWHHRRELIERALAVTPEEARVTLNAFTAYLHKDHHESLSFDSFDDRIISQYILKEVDSKNYHVWSHYMNILLLFPFLLQPFPASALQSAVDEAKNIENSTLNNMIYRRFCDPGSEFVPRSCNVLTAASISDVCQTPVLLQHVVTNNGGALCSEMAFTAQLIREDWFNNSAWSHRFAIFQRHVLCSLVAPDVVDMKTVFRDLCISEMVFALGWALAEPCNECPFVYLKGVADQYQLQQLTRLCASRGVAHPRDLPWSDYVTTLELHLRALIFLTNDVAPVVTSITRDDTERGVPRTKFLQNNLHQVAAAQFRFLFDTLEALWTAYYSEDLKQDIMLARPVAPTGANDESTNFLDLFTAGVDHTQLGVLALQLLIGESSEADSSLQMLDLKKWHSTVESLAVHIACQLFHTDVIRAKYWRHELETILFCSY